MKQHDGVRFFSSSEFAQWFLAHPLALEEVHVARKHSAGPMAFAAQCWCRSTSTPNPLI
jgi:hypothetical protein